LSTVKISVNSKGLRYLKKQTPMLVAMKQRTLIALSVLQ